MYNRKIKTSSHLFEGFEIDIDIRYFDNFDDIIKFFKIKLNNILKNNNLNKLLEISEKSNWHIHSTDFNEVLLNNIDIYLCDHK